jgi:hypothetical protein
VPRSSSVPTPSCIVSRGAGGPHTARGGPTTSRCLLNDVRRRYIEEFTKRGVKLCAISCDPVSEHVEWSKDICSSQGCAEVSFPILADQDRKIVTELGMIGALGEGAAQRHGRTRGAWWGQALALTRGTCWQLTWAWGWDADPAEQSADGLPMPGAQLPAPTAIPQGHPAGISPSACGGGGW